MLICFCIKFVIITMYVCVANAGLRIEENKVVQKGMQSNFLNKRIKERKYLKFVL